MKYLETFSYRMPDKPWIYIAATLIIFAISVFSVLWQTLRAARTNPSAALKKE
jgi:ABC-type antimicrobial peptide transport system permease subunit